MLRGGNKVTPVVDGDAEEETRPAVGTGGGTAATAAATPPPENPGKAYNENVASVFRLQVLQGIGDDGRDKDGNILRDKLYKALAALYKSSSAPLDNDPARLAAALNFASAEPVPEAEPSTLVEAVGCPPTRRQSADTPPGHKAPPPHAATQRTAPAPPHGAAAG